MKLKKVIEGVETRLPLNLQEDWDHCGLNLGKPSHDVRSVLFSYDICNEVIKEAKKKKCGMIVSHHPYRMGSSANVDLDEYEGKILAECLKSKIALYACHTNHDSSPDSLNFHYLKELGLEKVTSLFDAESGLSAIGTYGKSEKGMTKTVLVKKLKSLFKTKNIRFVSSKRKKYSKIGICTGSGASFIDRAIQLKLDLFITGDVKYHQAIHAKRHDLAIADVGHFYSEKDSVKVLKNIFEDIFGNELKYHVYGKLKDAFEFC